MPYINHHGRDEFDPSLESLTKHFETESGIPFYTAKMAGTLNYIVTQILLSLHPVTYSDYNTLIGVLECCKLEFYRRAVATYEDKKIEENGDVY